MDPETTALITQHGVTGLIVVVGAMVLRTLIANGLTLTVKVEQAQLDKLVETIENLTKFDERIDRLEKHDHELNERVSQQTADLSQQRAALSGLEVRVDERTRRHRSRDRMPAASTD